MSIDYNTIISSGSKGVFIRLLCIWKGSLYKLVWVDLMVYICLYLFVNFIYRFALNEPQKKIFEDVVMNFDKKKGNIPISFLLGFFVSGVINRWWRLYYSIPWLNKVAFISQSFIIGNGSENSRKFRIVLMRYTNLAWVLAMRQVSEQLKNRFTLGRNKPRNIQEVLESINQDLKVRTTFGKLVTEEELKVFKEIASQRQQEKDNENNRRTSHMPCGDINEPEYWIPLQWAVRLVHKAFVHGYMSDPRTMATTIEEINRLREDLHRLILNSSMLIPLVYTQVVIIAVFTFFLCNLFAEQFLDSSKNIKGHEMDFYFPFFNILQFLFIMGWLKVAMCVMNPFGDDDEDFETSAMFDYNLDTTYRCAGATEDLYPDLLEPPAVMFKCGDGVKEDNLNDFLSYQSLAMNVVQPLIISENINEGDGGQLKSLVTEVDGETGVRSKLL